MREKFEQLENRLREAKDLYEWERGASFLAVLLMKSIIDKMTKEFWLTAVRNYDRTEDGLRERLINTLLDIRLIKELPIDREE